MNEKIQDIYEKGTVVGQSGKIHKLQAQIDVKEGEYIYDIIRNNREITKTLEVGCAYGISSLHICSALKGREGASHTMIDPFQYKLWDGAGIKNLEDAGYNFFQLIETKSEFALPQLLQKKEKQFDFIFIDGYHTFDHALVDCFFATRLLRIGGLISIDDVSFRSVRRVVDFLRNYPCYEELHSVSSERANGWKRILLKGLASPISRRTWKKFLSPRLHRKIFDDQLMRMTTLKKVKEDERGANWHDDSF